MTVDLGLKTEIPASSPRFNWADPFKLEDELTEDERLIVTTTRSFAQDRLMPGITEANRDGIFDRSIMTEMGALGLLGSSLHGYGCAGASAVSYGLIAREIERVDSAYRSCLSVQSSLVMWPIYTYGTENQKQRFIPALAKGEIRCIGSTTYEEYKKVFEKDRALLRRFQKIDVNEPSVEDTIKILTGLRGAFQDHHDVKYTPDAIKSAVELSALRLPTKFQKNTRTKVSL